MTFAIGKVEIVFEAVNDRAEYKVNDNKAKTQPLIPFPAAYATPKNVTIDITSDLVPGENKIEIKATSGSSIGIISGYLKLTRDDGSEIIERFSGFTGDPKKLFYTWTHSFFYKHEMQEWFVEAKRPVGHSIEPERTRIKWGDSKLSVNEGDTISIKYIEGEANISGGAGKKHGPEGEIGTNGLFSPEHTGHSLLGKIGEGHGEVFQPFKEKTAQGATAEYMANMPGNLYFTIDDNNARYDDNTGGWELEVTILPPSTLYEKFTGKIATKFKSYDRHYLVDNADNVWEFVGGNWSKVPENRIKAVGKKAGTKFEMQQIDSIELHAGDWIDSFILNVQGHGGKGGAPLASIEVNQDTYIKSIEMQSINMSPNTFVRYLKIVTVDKLGKEKILEAGKRTPNQKAGDMQSLNGKIVAVEGCTDQYVNYLRFVSEE